MLQPGDSEFETSGYNRKHAVRLGDGFEKEFGTVLCANLTQCGLGSPEGQQKFKQLSLHKNLCSKFVQGVTRWVGEVMEGEPRA